MNNGVIYIFLEEGLRLGLGLGVGCINIWGFGLLHYKGGSFGIYMEREVSGKKTWERGITSQLLGSRIHKFYFDLSTFLGAL